MSKKTNTQKPQPAQVAAPEPLKIDNAKPVVKQAFWLLKTATASKIGKQAHGGLSYHLLSDVDRHGLHVAITGNDGGGYFSREIVPFIKVKACLTHWVAGKPFPSKVFRGAFVGRSSNNAGFLAAILRTEGLLAQAPDMETQHVMAGDWNDWQTLLLAEPGQMIEIAQPVSGIKPDDDAPDDDSQAHPKGSKTLSIKRPKVDVSEGDDGEGSHAHPA